MKKKDFCKEALFCMISWKSYGIYAKTKSLAEVQTAQPQA